MSLTDRIKILNFNVCVYTCLYCGQNHQSVYIRYCTNQKARTWPQQAIPGYIRCLCSLYTTWRDQDATEGDPESYSPEQGSKKPHTYISAWPLSSHLPLSSPQAPRLLWVGRELTAGSCWTGGSWLHPFPSQGGSAPWSPGRIMCPTPHRWQCWGAEASVPPLQRTQLRRKKS